MLIHRFRTDYRILSCLLSNLNQSRQHLSYVPTHAQPSNDHVEQLQNFINSSQRLFILTGAGISTESGIPDYRSEGVGLYARTKNRPMYRKILISHTSLF